MLSDRTGELRDAGVDGRRIGRVDGQAREVVELPRRARGDDVVDVRADRLLSDCGSAERAERIYLAMCSRGWK